jgi:hypothetical protein
MWDISVPSSKQKEFFVLSNTSHGSGIALKPVLGDQPANYAVETKEAIGR